MSITLTLVASIGCTPAQTDTLPTLASFPTVTENPPTETQVAISPTQEAESVSTNLETEEVMSLTTQVVDANVTEEVMPLTTQVVDANVTEEVMPLTTQVVDANVTEEVMPLTTQVVDANVTEEVMPLTTQVVDANVTEEVFATAESVRYQNEEGDLFIVVTSLLSIEQIPTLPEAPAGEQYVVLNTTIANLTGEPIEIDSESLSLIDREFNRYPPIAPDDFFRMPLVDATTDGTSTVVGMLRFSIPVDAIPYLLEWCPNSDCEAEVLQTLLP